MKQTENYQLNQWEGTDRILRTDFNADNAKVDSALQDLRKDVDAVESRAGAQLLKRESITGTSATVSLTSISWSQWKAVHINVYPLFESTGSIGLRINGGNDLIGAASGNISGSGFRIRHTAHVILYPLFDQAHAISAISLNSDSGTLYGYSIPFSDFEYVEIRCSGSSQMISGSYIEIWGEK